VNVAKAKLEDLFIQELTRLQPAARVTTSECENDRSSDLKPLLPRAVNVGYGRKKNLYQAFQQVTAVTLMEFRRLPDARAAAISETLRASLTGHPPWRAPAKLRRRNASELFSSDTMVGHDLG